jgi:3-oxoacyl-[acyl-carrier protein] reductase
LTQLDGRLAGQVALVSGAGRGIGRATAHKLAADGARLVLNDLDPEPLAGVASEIRALGGAVETHAGDAGDPRFGDAMVGLALEAFGAVDIIVNNAGYSWDNVIQKTSDEQFQTMLDVHCLSSFRLLRAASEPMRTAAKQDAERGETRHRKVVNVSSLSGIFGNPGQVGYAAAKAAIVGMTKTLAKEWGRYRINVNAVAFGHIATRLSQPMDTPEAETQIGARRIRLGIPRIAAENSAAFIPLGRVGTVEDAAGGIWLLCQPESDYITGHVLEVSGGLAF